MILELHNRVEQHIRIIANIIFVIEIEFQSIKISKEVYNRISHNPNTRQSIQSVESCIVECVVEVGRHQIIQIK